MAEKYNDAELKEKEAEVQAFLDQLDKSGATTKKKIEEIFNKYHNGRLEIAIRKLNMQIEADLKKYKA